MHYSFVRGQIESKPDLDRCDEDQYSEFLHGWRAFSASEYDKALDRRFLMGTLIHYAGSDFFALEFTTGDAIDASLMKRAYDTMSRSVYNAAIYAVVPRSDDHIAKVKSIEGTIPARGPNAPFIDLGYQILNPGVAYGYLRSVPSSQFPSKQLGPNDILYTDFVPVDLPAVRGLITTAFQTPLSHANVLSRNRGTPNIVLRDQTSPVDIASLIDQLVRLEVKTDGISIAKAELTDAQAAWGKQQRVQVPRIDLTERPIASAAIDIANISYADLPAFGGKAVQFAELHKIDAADSQCAGAFPAPKSAFAVPLYFYLEHVNTHGADLLIAKLDAEDDESKQETRLAQIRQSIADNPIRDAVVDRIYAELQARFGQRRVRFRSSSNTEDLPSFNGAGLYTSVGVDAVDGKAGVATAIKTVWASLWNVRAHRERRFFAVDESTVAMGVLIHEAIQGEVANGVAISRSVLNPIRGDIYYVNAQRGNASVVKPANNVVAEQFSYRWFRKPRQVFHAQSSFVEPEDVVLSPEQVDALACNVKRVHEHFRPLIDPDDNDPYFAIDVEFKFTGPSADDLLIKQARPYPFDQVETFTDCRTRE